MLTEILRKLFTPQQVGSLETYPTRSRKSAELAEDKSPFCRVPPEGCKKEPSEKRDFAPSAVHLNHDEDIIEAKRHALWYGGSERIDNVARLTTPFQRSKQKVNQVRDVPDVSDDPDVPDIEP